MRRSIASWKMWNPVMLALSPRPSSSSSSSSHKWLRKNLACFFEYLPIRYLHLSVSVNSFLSDKVLLHSEQEGTFRSRMPRDAK